MPMIAPVDRLFEFPLDVFVFEIISSESSEESNSGSIKPSVGFSGSLSGSCPGSI